MFCPKCGKENIDQAEFCQACGTSIQTTTVNPNAQMARPIASQPKSNGLAIASMVLGIVGLIFGWFILAVPSILAVIFGHIARKRIKRSDGTMSGSGMALAGLITGYSGIFIGLIGIIAAISIPAYLGMQMRAANTAAQTEIKTSCNVAQSIFIDNPEKTITRNDLEERGFIPSPDIEFTILKGKKEFLRISSKHIKGNKIYRADKDCNITEEKLTKKQNDK